jgi:hypothetical protein
MEKEKDIVVPERGGDDNQKNPRSILFEEYFPVAEKEVIESPRD